MLIIELKGVDIDKGGRNCNNIECSRPSAEAFHSTDKQYVGLQRYPYLTIPYINNLLYSDRYYNSDWQFEMFKRGKDNGHVTGFKCKFLIFNNIFC